MDVELEEHIVNLEALLEEMKVEPKEGKRESSPKKTLLKTLLKGEEEKLQEQS